MIIADEDLLEKRFSIDFSGGLFLFIFLSDAISLLTGVSYLLQWGSWFSFVTDFKSSIIEFNFFDFSSFSPELVRLSVPNKTLSRISSVWLILRVLSSWSWLLGNKSIPKEKSINVESG